MNVLLRIHIRIQFLYFLYFIKHPRSTLVMPTWRQGALNVEAFKWRTTFGRVLPCAFQLVIAKPMSTPCFLPFIFGLKPGILNSTVSLVSTGILLPEGGSSQKKLPHRIENHVRHGKNSTRNFSTLTLIHMILPVYNYQRYLGAPHLSHAFCLVPRASHWSQIHGGSGTLCLPISRCPTPTTVEGQQWMTVPSHNAINTFLSPRTMRRSKWPFLICCDVT